MAIEKVNEITSELTSALLEANDYWLYALKADGTIDYKVKSSTLSPVKVAKIPLTAAQLKTGFSSPIEAIVAPGVGKAVLVTDYVLKFTANTTPFTSDDIILYTDTSGAEQFQASGILSSGANAFTTIPPSYGGAGNINIVENKAVYIKTDSDSAVGDGTAILYLSYRTISL